MCLVLKVNSKAKLDHIISFFSKHSMSPTSHKIKWNTLYELAAAGFPCYLSFHLCCNWSCGYTCDSMIHKHFLQFPDSMPFPWCPLSLQCSNFISPYWISAQSLGNASSIRSARGFPSDKTSFNIYYYPFYFYFNFYNSFGTEPWKKGLPWAGIW